MAETERISERALTALHEAALAVAGNLSLEKVLRQIVESARELSGARYAALGIPDNRGRLQRFIHSGMDPQTVAKIDHLPEGRGLLGALLHEGHTIRIPRISDDPRSVGFPENHPPMNSFLGVPIPMGEEIAGNLYLAEKRNGSEFTESDEQLIELLAAHAGIAIKNARLYEEVGRLAIVEERSRIGMDLHDGVIQSIYAVGLTLESARLMLVEEEQPQVMKALDGAIGGLNDAIRDIRNFILDLRPRRFEGELAEGLARLAREFQANTMVPVTLDVVDEDVIDLPFPLSRDVFLTAQEALANVARHARASQVKMAARREDSSIVLHIEDNGVGFDLSEQIHATGHGLANMRARAEERQGTLSIKSTRERGTTIHLELPL